MESWRTQPLAVLVSGGPDSMVLLAELAQTSPRAAPVYVRCGMRWEPIEERTLRRFIAALSSSAIAELKVFDLPLAPVYGSHWSTTGNDVPDAASPDSAVFLPGRNLLILAQAAIWCHLQGVRTLALGLLQGNPFPDSSEAFFRAYETALNEGLGSRLRIVRPYQKLSKPEVLARGRDLPLNLTWSCIDPVNDLHCGRCNKCAERQRAFATAAIEDPTQYTIRV
jgi:7-cyano-7-deazaguanine synthase